MTTRQEIIDSLLQGAQRAQRDAIAADEHARLDRMRRDVFIRKLYATGGFTYPQLGKLVGISAELVAKIVNRTEKSSAAPKSR